MSEIDSARWPNPRRMRKSENYIHRRFLEYVYECGHPMAADGGGPTQQRDALCVHLHIKLSQYE